MLCDLCEVCVHTKSGASFFLELYAFSNSQTCSVYEGPTVEQLWLGLDERRQEEEMCVGRARDHIQTRAERGVERGREGYIQVERGREM